MPQSGHSTTTSITTRDMDKPIGITMGDPAGIGPEIIIKLFTSTAMTHRSHIDHQPCESELSAPQLPGPLLVYGDAGCLRRTAAGLGMDCVIQPIASAQDLPSPAPVQPQQARIVIPVIETLTVDPDLPIGRVSAQAGQSAYASVSHAIDDALSGNIRAIVTAPLNKEAIGLSGIQFPGHTEILAARSGDVPVAMMLANASLRVILVTIHMALRDVAQALSVGLELQTIRMAQRACHELGIRRPRIAVAGLNPHAGENGKFGHEEHDLIEPAIALARAEGIDATGPWPGDTVFARARQGEFDIVVAQYHDQGLIPVKYMGLDEGVNVTVGLPFVRTSVDHGTAFDIAGKGIASEDSLRCALLMADQLARARATL